MRKLTDAEFDEVFYGKYLAPVSAMVRLQIIEATMQKMFEVNRQEPVAWMTHHDEPMLFLTRDEAEQYCEDCEGPIPLYM